MCACGQGGQKDNNMQLILQHLVTQHSSLSLPLCLQRNRNKIASLLNYGSIVYDPPLTAVSVPFPGSCAQRVHPLIKVE